MRTDIAALPRRFAILLATGALMSTAPVFACESVDLFRVITVRDEIIIGITERDSAEMHGRDVSAIGRALAVEGELTLWQYAVRKANDGELELAPLQRVSILKHQSLRLEPYPTPLRILAIPDEGVERDPPKGC